MDLELLTKIFIESAILAKDIMILYSISLILPISTLETINREIKMNKISKYDNSLIKKSIYPENYLSVTELKKEYNNKLKETILKIENYVDKKNLIYIYNNLKNTKVKKNKFIALWGSMGTYETKKDIIRLASKGVSTHEGLHAASGYFDEKTGTEFCGFKQRKRAFKIGDGIDEGYTELLASRIDQKKPKSYKNAVRVARMFETFFDDPIDMEKLYFSHDLLGLVNHLKKYASKEEVLKLIANIDTMIEPRAPLASLSFIKVHQTLYKMAMSKNNTLDKREKFINIFNEQRIFKWVHEKQEFKLKKNMNNMNEKESKSKERFVA